MAEAALVVAIVAALAAIAAAVSAWRSARYARQVADIEEDRRHDELAPQLELQPHRHTTHGPDADDGGDLKRRFRIGGMITNHGPRPCSILVLWDGEVRRGDGDKVRSAGLVDFSTTPVRMVGELDLGLLSVGEGRWFQLADLNERETAALTFIATDGEGRTWKQQLSMTQPSWHERWPSSSSQQA